jgi:uncharacterized membrane protein YadS
MTNIEQIKRITSIIVVLLRVFWLNILTVVVGFEDVIVLLSNTKNSIPKNRKGIPKNIYLFIIVSILNLMCLNYI